MAATGDDSLYRLARTALPSRYDLELAPDLEKLTFAGWARVEITVSAPLDELVLNSDELEIFDASLTAGWDSQADEGASIALQVTLEQELERVHFVPPSPIAAGRYTLRCSFSGVLNDLLVGFYRSRFVDDDGVEHTIATTTFEETDARKAFPCFDEPDMKAVFGVTLVAPAGNIAVSNGKEIASEQLDGGATRYRFGDTISMSTYLVAFVVGPMVVSEPIDVDGIEVRVVHVPGKERFTATPLDMAAHTLRFFCAYYDIGYPGDKLDLVAMPDFASGAMENLGCVIFREADLLVDPERTSLPEMIRVSEVIDHELAHMWFGDLVTMAWWNGVWLNEAFATFMSMLCQSDYRPQWNSFLAFSRLRARGLAVDGLSSTRPIEIPVISPDDASAMFDPPITYYKGGSVLWMIEQFLGHEGFRNGVRRYLRTHAYGNTETSDLWDALEAENPDVPVRALMESWIFQGGYPLVSARSVGAGAVEIRQEPFSYLPAEEIAKRPSNIAAKWMVPVIAGSTSDRGRVEKVVLESAPQVLDVGNAPAIVNAGGTGFYRVRYDPELLADLLASFASLQPLERFGLVSDTWAATQSGAAAVGQFFAVVRQLAGESDPFVWSIAVGALNTIDRVAPDGERARLAEFIRKTLRPELERIGWGKRPGEDDHLAVLRGVLIGGLGTTGDDQDVFAKAHQLFLDDRTRGQEIDVNIAMAVLQTVAAHADEGDFATLLERFRAPLSPLDEHRYEFALAALTDIGQAHALHEMCRAEIRSQDAPYLLSAMMHSRTIGPATWEFVAEHFDELESKYPPNSIDRMLEGIASLADLDGSGRSIYLDAVQEFVSAKVTGARRRAVDQSVEILEVNVRLASRLASSLGATLGSA